MVGLATVFGAGGGTSSYEEVEHTDLVLLWGSNARAAHPIFFHHVLRGLEHGARLIVVDPRRTESAAFADLWLGIDVGTDIALSNTIAREIIANDLQNHAFVDARHRELRGVRRERRRTGRSSAARRSPASRPT